MLRYLPLAEANRSLRLHCYGKLAPKSDLPMDYMLRPVTEGSNLVVTLEPIPDFVVKSRLLSEHGRPSHLLQLKANKKIFINVCHHDKVPKPAVEFDSSVVYPLIMNNQWEIPIVTSSAREDRDKKGDLCYVWDCCINTDCMSWIEKDLQLREIVIEWCFESCEVAEAVEISREHIAFPRMKKKGDVIPALEIHSADLASSAQERIADAAEPANDDPSSILKMRRTLQDDDAAGLLGGTDDDDLPPLIPVANQAKKPLIEEIDNLQITEKKRNKTTELLDLHFDVRIRKTKNPEKFKLRIEIASEIDSAFDLELVYGLQENALEMRNTNTNVFKEQKLQIPLPNIFSDADIQKMKTFFLQNDKKIIIFI